MIPHSRWKKYLADRWADLTDELTIAMVGKYTELSDAYLSVIKALTHACLRAGRKLKIDFIEASQLEDETRQEDAEGAPGGGGMRWQVSPASGCLGGCGVSGCQDVPIVD